MKLRHISTKIIISVETKYLTLSTKNKFLSTARQFLIQKDNSLLKKIIPNTKIYFLVQKHIGKTDYTSTDTCTTNTECFVRGSLSCISNMAEFIAVDVDVGTGKNILFVA